MPNELTTGLIPLYPVAILVVGGTFALFAGLLGGRRGALYSFFLYYLPLASAFVSTARLWGSCGESFYGMLLGDDLAHFTGLVLIAAAALTYPLLASGRPGQRAGALPGLVLLTTAALVLVASTRHVLFLFLCLETASLGLYAMAGFGRESRYCQEAGLKYLLLGTFASGFFALGLAFYFVATKSFLLAPRLPVAPTSPLLFAALALLLVGLGFKIGAVPFHSWVPDVYEGAPTAVTAFMSVAVKAAAFVALLRVVVGLAPTAARPLLPVFWVLAAVTMAFGVLVAVFQHRLKRMLAYSSIASAGYLLVLFTSPSPLAVPGLLYFLAAYVVMNVGAFGAVLLLERAVAEPLEFEHCRGLGYRYPLLSAALALFLLALAGLPPTAGFLAKFYIFRAALDGGRMDLALVLALFSVVSGFYYIRVLVFFYMKEAEGTLELRPLPRAGVVALVLCAIGVVLFGLFPGLLTRYADQAFNQGLYGAAAALSRPVPADEGHAASLRAVLPE